MNTTTETERDEYRRYGSQMCWDTLIWSMDEDDGTMLDVMTASDDEIRDEMDMVNDSRSRTFKDVMMWLVENRLAEGETPERYREWMDTFKPGDLRADIETMVKHIETYGATCDGPVKGCWECGADMPDGMSHCFRCGYVSDAEAYFRSEEDVSAKTVGGA